MNKLDGKSLDIKEQNIQQLKELFPEVFSEGKLNLEKLQEELGEFSDKENERYNFTWNGKQEAKRIAQTPSTGTLRPSKEDSKNWDTTQNLYIEGDNLEVLKLLQKSYHKQVKMIYIDPPYNTGKDFVYKDNFKDNIKNYLEQTGQVDSDGNRLSTNSDTSGRYHSDWLNMMYPRLKLARNLLKDDGVIFISIDDNEVSNLRNLCNEIFGEECVEQYIWDVREDGTMPKTAKNTVRKEHEYLLVAFKNTSNQRLNKYTSFKYKDNNWGNIDNDPRGGWMSANISRGSGEGSGGSKSFTITNPKGIEFYRDWSISEDEYFELLKDNRIYFADNGNGVPRRKIFQNEPVESIQSSIFEKLQSSQSASKDVQSLIGTIEFDYPKPTKLLERILQIGCNKNDVVLDFFSGSATTAHAVMKLNSGNEGSIKYIMVQLPEETDEKSEAYKAGYKNICEIGKERIRRAGEKIKADNPDKDLSNLDIGFKVYKLDSSNIKEWDSDFDNLEANLLDSIDNIKSDRTSEDLLYEILLKYGLDLTLPIEEKTIADKTVYNIGFGALVVCLDDEITIEVVEAIAEFIKEQVVYDEEKKKRHARVVFKDKSFADTNVKTNAIQVLKQFDIDEVVSI